MTKINAFIFFISTTAEFDDLSVILANIYVEATLKAPDVTTLCATSCDACHDKGSYYLLMLTRFDWQITITVHAPGKYPY